MSARLATGTDATASSGDVRITAIEQAAITATSTATAMSIALSGGGNAPGFAGGGATAVNAITGSADAYASASKITAKGSGNVWVTTTDSATIDATVKAVAAAVAGSLENSVPGVAIGFSLARNFIGWTEFGGTNSISVNAYLSGGSVSAAGKLTISATDSATINAVVEALSAAIALSDQNAVAVSAGGLWTDNKVSADVEAYASSVTSISTGAAGIAITASDSAKITADARAAAISASLAGENGVGVAVGLSLAHNTISDTVAAYLSGDLDVTTSGGPIVITALSQATIV